MKRSLLTDGNGIPLGVSVSGANTHDKWLVEDTLRSVPLATPQAADVPQHLCLDKGYDYAEVRQVVAEYGTRPLVNDLSQRFLTRTRGSFCTPRGVEQALPPGVHLTASVETDMTERICHVLPEPNGVKHIRD